MLLKFFIEHIFMGILFRMSSIPNSENPRKIEFYTLDASSLNGPWRELLREYSGIPDQEVDGHVEAMVGTLTVWKYS
jgi:hypothetical protein